MMNPFSSFGKTLLIVGIILSIVGILMLVGPKIPWVGKLPGDINIKKDGFQLYFPVTTCVIISVLVTLIFYFFKK